MTDIPIDAFFSLQGRIGRKRYIVTSLILAVSVGPLLVALDHAEGTWLALTILLLAPLVWISLCAGVQRLHDIGLSGWFVLLALVPLVNLLLGLYLFFKGGTAGANKYMLSPVGASTLPPGIGDYVEVPDIVTRKLGSAMPAIEYARRNNLSELQIKQRIDNGYLKSLLHEGVLFVQNLDTPVNTPAPTPEHTRETTEAPIPTSRSNAPASSSLHEDSWYEQALAELERGQPNKAMWARALATSNGDEAKKNGTYIRLRVAQLQALQEAEQLAIAEAERAASIEAETASEKTRDIRK